MEEKRGNDNRPEWMNIILRYNKPDKIKSWWQLINSIVPYVVLWVLMVKSLEISYWLTLFLSVFASGFLVRIFIIFHDCGHGSFFRSRRMNLVTGMITGLIVFTPYHKWHHDHKIHHNTVGNLEKRGTGDVKTLTVEEYKKLTRWKKFSYGLYRHPLFLFGIAPILLFVIQHRLPHANMSTRQKLYVQLTNLALAAAIALMVWAIGWRAFILIQLPVLYTASVLGVWLFYVQHQFKDVTWTDNRNWDYKTMALEGSSLYKLPPLLNWFTGSIGYHHIHHLSPAIPNYNLKKCHRENSIFQKIRPITFITAFGSHRLRLWDEKTSQMISFREMRPAKSGI
jgi:omega-6 fatty acid desaturase (delta-12 desaturase)